MHQFYVIYMQICKLSEHLSKMMLYYYIEKYVIIPQIRRRDLSSCTDIIKCRKRTVMLKWCLPIKTANNFYNVDLYVKIEQML